MLVSDGTEVQKERKRKKLTLTQNTHPAVILCTDTNQHVTAAPNHNLIKLSLDQIPVLNPTINQNVEY